MFTLKDLKKGTFLLEAVFFLFVKSQQIYIIDELLQKRPRIGVYFLFRQISYFKCNLQKRSYMQCTYNINIALACQLVHAQSY